MEPKVIHTLPEFVESVCDIRSTFVHESILCNEISLFRGHADENFELLPSLARGREDEFDVTLLNLERSLITLATYKYPNLFGKNLLPIERLTLLQHYGIPTRLLDVTENCLVALYFACCSLDDKNGEVFMFKINEQHINNFPILQAIADSGILCNSSAPTSVERFYEHAKQQPYFTEFQTPTAYINSSKSALVLWIKNIVEYPIFIHAPYQTIRQRLQQSRYILFANQLSIESTIDDDKKYTAIFTSNISAIPKDDSSIAARFIIDSKSKKEILKQLRMFGICRETLFADSPDIVCEEIKKDTFNSLMDDSIEP